MKKKIVVLLLGTSMLLAACGGEEESSDGSNANTTASGDVEKIVQQNCIGCHGENLQGRNGPDLTEIGAKYNKDEIKDILVNGYGRMPKVLGEAEAETVASWLAEKK